MNDAMPTEPQIEVRRSARRTRTVSAYEREGRVVVMIPARFSAAEEAEWVEKMLAKLQRSRSRRSRRPSDQALMRRARELDEQYLRGRGGPISVRWVDNMTTRWGSCTVSSGEIRLSHQLQAMPAWVIDYVLLHELAHLLEPGHGSRFWKLVDQLPRAERAKGYLQGVSHASGRDLSC